MEIVEEIRCRGHVNVRALHKSTFEITKETELSPNGDCIIAVGADKGAADLSPEFRRAVGTAGAILITTLTVQGISVDIRSEGHEGITLTHPTDLVWRRSCFTCPRTIGIYADHTAAHIPRVLIDKLKEGDVMNVTLRAVLPEPEFL